MDRQRTTNPGGAATAHMTGKAAATHVRGFSLGLLGQTHYRRLWIAQTTSNAGSSVSSVALPLTAVVVLGATPTQMGTLNAAATLPALLLSLFVGVWVDRLRRRPLLIVADLGRALLLALIPLTAFLGVLRIELLYLVGVLAGTLTLFFDVAVTSYIPVLVQRDELVEANAKLQMGSSAARIGGPSVAGLLVQLVGAPFVILLDALSFLVSGFLVGGITVAEPHAPATKERPAMWREIQVGARWVWNDDIVRATVLAAAVGSFSGAIQQTVYVLFVTRQVGVTPFVLGLLFSCSGVAAVAGALVAEGLARRFGPGKALIWGQAGPAASMALVPLAGIAHAAATPLLTLAQVLVGVGLTVFSITQISLRQAVTPPHLLGCVNATRRLVVFGVQPIGAVVGGLLGTSAGLRATLMVAATIQVLSFIVAFCSPLRSLETTPATEAETTEGVV